MHIVISRLFFFRRVFQQFYYSSHSFISFFFFITHITSFCDFYYFVMQFFFAFHIVFNCYTIKVINSTTRANQRVQIFENFFFNDFLHDSNSFIFSIFKRFIKRFFQNITINANNKFVKKKREKFFETKNKFHVFEKSRIDSSVTFYFSFFFVYIRFTKIFTQTLRLITFFFFFYIFFVVFLVFFDFVYFFFRSVFFVFRSKRKEK